MDSSTEYCSFVSVDYIICECGNSFPNEDELRDHLEIDHATMKQENKPTPLYDHFVKDKNIKKEFDQPLVITEKLPEADLENAPMYLENTITNDYYIDGTQSEPAEYYETDDIKQETIVEYVQYEDTIEQDYYETETRAVVIEKTPEVRSPFGSRQVTFKTSQLPEQLVIVSQENEEHDYDRETKPACQEYYFCEVCGKCFTAEKAVHIHMKIVHRIGESGAREQKQKTAKTSVCDVCGKKYAMWQRSCSGCGGKRPVSKQSERAREKRRQNQHRFTCDICGVCRSSNAALRYHQRIHTGERPYKCPLCPKAFTMPLFLQLHTRTHTGERPYQCPECPKAFSSQAALVRHNRVHTGVKPYSCPECGKAFTQSNSMKLHYQTVHLKMPAPYKSAARRLRDAQKLGQRLGANKIIIKEEPTSSPEKRATVMEIEPEAEVPDDRRTLLFRHRRRRGEDTQYEYVIENSLYIPAEQTIL